MKAKKRSPHHEAFQFELVLLSTGYGLTRKLIRQSLWAGLFIIPVWGLLLMNGFPEYNEPPVLRGLIVGFCASILVFDSLIRSFRSFLPLAFESLIWLLCAFSGYILWINHFNEVGAISYIVTVMSCFCVLHQGRALWAFALVFVGFPLISAWISGYPIEEVGYGLLCSLSLLIMGYFFYSRSRDLSRVHELLRTRQKEWSEQSKWAQIGFLSGSIAHEINSPLAAINLLLDLVEKESERGHLTREGFHDKSARIRQIVGHIANLVRSLKRLARPRQENEVVEMRLNEGLQSYLALMGAKSRKEGFEILLDPSLSQSDRLLALSESDFVQILIVLTDNAAQAYGDLQGPRQVKIFPGFESQESFSVIVEDQGVGFDEKSARRAFMESFTSKKVGQGTGLGLVLVRRLIENAGGRVRILSNAKPTQIEVSIPKAVLRELAAS